MQKIMFSDKFGLTQAVIDGRKTMTRRLVSNVPCFAYKENGVKKHGGIEDMEIRCGDTLMLKFRGDWYTAPNECQPRYKIGEEVAVAQNYEQAGWNPDTLQQTYVKKPTIFPDLDEYDTMCGLIDLPLKYHKGWTNKMFVLGDLMPHRIKITNIKTERLQDISEEDCLKEGVKKCNESLIIGYPFGIPFNYCIERDERGSRYTLAREAFAVLIDKINGKGTWDRNPWVFVYEFELVK